MNEHDIQIPEEIEETGRQQLAAHFERLPAFETRIKSVSARPGGLLARENAQTAYDPIEWQVHHLASSALEPLTTCQRLLEGEGLPMLSLYPLIRASIEASGYAIWLLVPGTSHKRVLRSLKLTKKRREDADAATAKIVPADAEKTRQFHERLAQLKAMNRNLSQNSLDVDFPNTTDILIDAARHITTTPYDIVTTWRICSGLTHSNNVMAQRILERKQVTAYTDGVAQFHMTSSFIVVESLLRPAVQAMEQLIDRFEARAIES